MALKINQQIGIIQVSYTPEFFKRAMNNYKFGYFWDIIALYEQAEIDSHVMGCIEGRQDGYKTSWRLTEATSSPQDKEIKDFVEAVFMGLDMFDLFDFIHDARLKEFSIIEPTWEVINGKQWVTKVEKINQRYFRRDMADHKLKINGFGSEMTAIPEEEILVCESVKPALLIPVVRDFILKEFGIECFASFIENFGEGFILGTYPPGAGQEVKDELEAAVNKLGASSRGIKPEGTSIDIIESKKGTTDHDKFIEIGKNGISVTLLGHENAVTNRGGMQIGESQAPYKAQRAKVIADIVFIEKFMYQFEKMIVNRNYLNVKKYPIFSIERSEPIDTTLRLAVIDSAYAKGFKVSADEFGKLGLIVAEDQEPFLTRDFNNPADTGI